MSDVSNNKCICYIYRLKEYKTIAYMKIVGSINYDRIGTDRYYLNKLERIGYTTIIVDLNDAICSDLIDPLYGFPNLSTKRIIVILAKRTSQVVRTHFNERLGDVLSNWIGETILECVEKIKKMKPIR